MRRILYYVFRTLTLTTREQFAIAERTAGKSWRQIGASLGVTRGRAWQIYERAKTKTNPELAKLYTDHNTEGTK